MAISARAIAPTVALLASFAGAAAAHADLALDPLFREHAVLQRMRPIPVEGRTAPGAAVEVEFAGKKASGKARGDGRFTVELPAMPHSAAPATLVVRSGGEEVRVGDVLVGEVWFCSGQSNMEWTVDASNDADRAREIAPLRPIRSFKAPHVTANEPQATVPGEWRVASAQTVGSFTAVGFWFGARLAESLDVPVGLVDISWGGTRIEPWIPLDAMKRSSFKDRAEALAAQIAEHARIKPEDRAAAAAAELERYRAACDAYWTAAVKAETGGDAKAVPAPDFPNGWSKARLPAYFPALDPALGGFDGFVWFAREFDVPAPMAGKPLVLHLPAIDDCDLTMIDGATVGSTVANWNTPRTYSMPDGLSAGRHRIVVAVLDMAGQGGFAAGDMRLELASGDAALDLSGAWLWRRGGGVPQVAVPMLRDVTRAPGTEPHEPAAIWNAMMAPCIRFPARGVIWYQGESNAGEPDAYRALLPLLMRSWREKSGNADLAWGIVQLAAFMRFEEGQPVQRGWAELRESQYRGAAEAGGGMASAIDLGEADDIHPRRKREVGERLAAWAMATAYGKGGSAWRGPELREAVREGRAVRLRFDYADGLKATGGEPGGFAVCGADGAWAWATARVEGTEVVVECAAVAEPAGVAYAWQNNPVRANMADADGLPIVPFKVMLPAGAR